MYRTRNYFKKDIVNILLIVIMIILSFIKLWLSLLLFAGHIIFLINMTNIITITKQYIIVNFPYRTFGKHTKVELHAIKKIIIKKYGRVGYGSMPYLLLFYENKVKTNKKKVVPISSSMRKEERQKLIDELASKVGSKLEII